MIHLYIFKHTIFLIFMSYIKFNVSVHIIVILYSNSSGSKIYHVKIQSELRFNYRL